MPKRSMIRKAITALAALTATVMVAGCGGSPQAHSITITFVRHAQSEANASGTINTEIPGPGLSQTGKGQAEQLAHQLGHKDYDSVYASVMTRAQETAKPLAAELGKQVEVLQGIQEINAGWYNGKPESLAKSTYMVAPAAWLQGDISDSIPGSINGKEFNDQFTAAINKIYNSNHNNPLVVSHMFAIEVWTLLNTKNGKDSLMDSHPLPNTGRVVITGNPTNGWKLVDWDGIRDFQN